MPSPFLGWIPILKTNIIDIASTVDLIFQSICNHQVRPKYIARIGERIEVSDLGRVSYPDAMIVQPPRNPATTLAHSGVLVADEPLVFHYLDQEHSVPYIEIVYAAGDVVTVIEVLSPANKNGAGREQYLQKQADTGNPGQSCRNRSVE